MNIIQVNGTANTTTCNRTPKYLVLHYTASTSSNSGHAKSIAQYFAKKTTKASADFIVDDSTIVQYNADPKKRYCWAVGGSKYAKPSTSLGGKIYSIANNSNCISIEMCSCKKSTKTLNASDNDWYITDAVLNNTVELSKYLMKLYNISIDNVIMHHMVTGKVCPNPWCVKESALSNWYNFKSKLTSTTTNGYIYDGLDYSLVFDLTYYCNNQPDVVKALGTSQSAIFGHFINNGMKEGRQAISTFNVNVYKNNYADLRSAFGDDLVKYYQHYITNGHNEGRKAI